MTPDEQLEKCPDCGLDVEPWEDAQSDWHHREHSHESVCIRLLKAQCDAWNDAARLEQKRADAEYERCLADVLRELRDMGPHPKDPASYLERKLGKPVQ